MLDHADYSSGFIGFTWRTFLNLKDCICSLVVNHCKELVGFPLEKSRANSAGEEIFNCVKPSNKEKSTFHAPMDPIDISSDSDSMIKDDSDFDDPSPVKTTNDSRILPQGDSAAGSGRLSQNATSKRPYASNGSSSNLRASQPNDSLYVIENGITSVPRTVNSRIGNVSGADYEKLSSQQACKRTLPPSLQRFPISSKSNNLGEGTSNSQIRGTYGNTYQPAGPSSSHGKGYTSEYYGRGHHQEAMAYENNGSRVLPISLMHGKQTAASLFGSIDPACRSMPGEDGVAGSDERLIYQAALEDLCQPKVEANLPDGLLSVPLLRHQKIALAWMIQRETKSAFCLGGILGDDQGLGKTISMIALIQMQKLLQSKSKSDGQSQKLSEAFNLDDDDENGRPDLIEVKENEESGDVKLVPEAINKPGKFKRKRPEAGTLVVCPASILRQWARELDDKVADEAKLTFLIYHGGGRTRDPMELARNDVVLTTYAIITNEVPKQPQVNEDEPEEKEGEGCGLTSEFSMNKKRNTTSSVGKKRKRGKKGIDSSFDNSDRGPLALVNWSRVILDEAQTIKNHRTQVARACCSLRAKRRWCLSGTPIQNAIDDLYSYFRFLRYDPYSLYKSFYTTLKVPISRNSLQGYKKLQAVLRAVMLRRTKGTIIDGQPIIKLPPKTICLKKVNFSAEERAFYTRLEADSRSKFKAYAAAGTVNQNYANILLMLLRLRQACDHPLLVKGFNSDSLEKVSVETAKILPCDMVIDLLRRLATSSAICRVCNDTPVDPVVTICGHVFCYECVSDPLTGEENTCPAHSCKEQLSSDVVFTEATLRSRMSENLDAGPRYPEFDDRSMVLQNEYTSSKINTVLGILQSHLMSTSAEPAGSSSSPAEGPIKSIVFSQWTRMLDLVESSLNQFCIQYRRLDGSMSLAARDRAVKDFNSDPEVTLMLMSLKAGNLGLNMVAACHVILLDLWWNPTTEDQAIDRAHRIGQTRPVTVTRLTVKDTVEDRILALQEEKRKMVASAFGEDSSGGGNSRLTAEDLQYLFMGRST